MQRDGTALPAQHSLLELWSRRNSSCARQSGTKTVIEPSLISLPPSKLQAFLCSHNHLSQPNLSTTELVVSSSKSSPDLRSLSVRFSVCQSTEHKVYFYHHPLLTSVLSVAQRLTALTPQYPLKCRVGHFLMIFFFFLCTLEEVFL